MAAYQVLARKWRPKTFADLVGQQHVVKALQNALAEGRLHHAYLLTGTRGVGKTTIARILAKSFNCEQLEHGEPCGVCQSCRDIDAGRFVDLLEIDAASNTGIDNIREVLENAQYAPTAGKYKVYIIDEVHMLSKSAFNAMLKTLEEPPEHVKFILATTDPHKVPITVLSRCLQFILRNITAQQVSDHLAHVLKSEQIVYEPAALALLGRAAQGSMRDALSLLDQAIAMGSGSVQEADVRDMIGAVDKRYLYELLTYLMEQDGENLIAKAQEMAANAIGFDSALNELAVLFQRIALLKTVPAAISQDDPEHDRLLQLAQYFSDEQIQLYYQCVIHGKQDLSLAPDEYAGFVMTLLRMLAFAPFAAKNTPLNATIEGTQLHNPPEKKSNLKQDDKIIQKQFSPQELPPVHREDIRREPPDVSGSVNGENIENQNITSESDADNVSGSLNGENIKNQNITAESDSDNVSGSLNSENIENQEIAAKSDSDNISESCHYDDDKIFENQYIESDYPYYADHIPFEDLPSTPPNRAAQENGTESLKAAEPEHTPETPVVFGELPEFKQENWHQIAAYIVNHVGLGRMVLQHLAWVDFHDSILHLALRADKASAAAKPEYLKQIETMLRKTYQIDLKLQIQDWQNDSGWQTPAMYREQLKQEQHETALRALNSDAAAQQLLHIFGGKWLDESVVLLAPPLQAA